MGWNYEKKYQEIIAGYNQDKDRATIEDTFAKLIDLAANLDAEQRRAAEEGLGEDELAMFDLLTKPTLTKADRERVKLVSQELLSALKHLIGPLEQWTEKEQTQADVEIFILDKVFEALPKPAYTPEDKQEVARLIYRHIWQQSAGGGFGGPSSAA